VSKSYLKLYLDSEIAHGFFKRFSHGGTMEILNLGILRELPIPLPSIAEQTEIVRRVEQLFAFADQLETRVKATQARVNGLTQSILTKAFRGELVQQDANDEPAGVLLERIKAQRAAAPKAKRGRRPAMVG
jgi:type I restriction enzyme S subunit